MIIALASPHIATSLENGLSQAETLVSQAAHANADIVCFPEAYLPGLRGLDFDVAATDAPRQAKALEQVCNIARRMSIAIIMGMERYTDDGCQIVSYVIDAHGTVQGFQTKNQLDPSEDHNYIPGSTRRLFHINGVAFGIAICHEGFRYPETVRWAAARGASIVFHPQLTGSNVGGNVPTQWGDVHGPYYEKAIMCRSIENHIYFASVNYATRFQESATCVIDPDGRCQAYLPYGHTGVLVQPINVARATGTLAKRLAPERYREFQPGDLE